MEQLLHYVWKHKLFPLQQLHTTHQETVEVIDVGLHNHDAGPDFFNAKIKINGTLWVGNVEIHVRSSEWFQHQHQHDPHYNNVILHIVQTADTEVMTTLGNVVPQLELPVPTTLADEYHRLLHTERYPPCYNIIPQIPSIVAHAWLDALQTERLEQKTAAIMQRLQQCNGSWEQVYFITLARNFSFGINSDVFEQWASNLPITTLDHHRDNALQIESLFFGQAGLLQPDALPEKYKAQCLDNPYFQQLQKEYAYLAHKLQLTPIDGKQWRFLRLRPQNFPHIRLSQLAQLYIDKRTQLSLLLECNTLEEVEQLYQTHATPYWQGHYHFGSVLPLRATPHPRKLSKASVRLLIINTAVPMLFAYGKHRNNEARCSLAIEMLQSLLPETNHITKLWQECGLKVDNAAHSQALIQLKKSYCDRKDCLRCRIGHLYLQQNTPKHTPNK